MIDYIEAHKFSMNNRNELNSDTICVYFYCLKIFNPKEITKWIDDTSGTALCPYCGIDSIIGEYTGYPITQEFMEKMYQYWF